MDYRDAFATQEIFPTREDLINWARAVGKSHGFVVVISRSDAGGVGKKTLVTLGCERSGKYRPYKDHLLRKVPGSKKCECPFKLRGRPVRNKGWKLTVLCGYHNHERSEVVLAHSLAGRLSDEERSLVADLTKNNVKPKDILMTLKERYEGNVSTIKTIYNACQAYRRSLKGPKQSKPKQIKWKQIERKQIKRKQISDQSNSTSISASSDESSEGESTEGESTEGESLVQPKAKTALLLLDQLPHGIHDYIEQIIDVKPDGNCGYRAVAALLGKGEESWAVIRQELIRELKSWYVDYVKLFGTEQRVKELITSLYVDSCKNAPEDKWMTIPDMGYVIASKYNVVLVSLSIHGCMTFFPLRGQPPQSQARHRVICIGFDQKCHFVQVLLKEGSPIPPAALQWHTHCHDDARSWEMSFAGRIEEFKRLVGDKHGMARTRYSLVDGSRQSPRGKDDCTRSTMSEHRQSGRSHAIPIEPAPFAQPTEPEAFPGGSEDTSLLTKSLQSPCGNDDCTPSTMSERARRARSRVAPVEPASLDLPAHPEAFPGGPEDTSLLTKYSDHVAAAVWRSEDRGELKVVSNGQKVHQLPLENDVVQEIVDRSGLAPLLRCSYSTADYGLLSAFVERWHPETCTFHLPVGEMAVTLDDVKSLLGLPIAGELYTSPKLTKAVGAQLMEELLGVTYAEAYKEMTETRCVIVRSPFLKKVYERKVAARRYDEAARAFLLRLVSCTILSDKSFGAARVEYLEMFRDLETVSRFSWGVMAFMHATQGLSEACVLKTKQLAGFCTLLQAWVYEHFPGIGQAQANPSYTSDLPTAARWIPPTRPTLGLSGYRLVLDRLTPVDILWTPYAGRREHCPFDDRAWFRGYFRFSGYVSLHLPDRVLRQYGHVQSIPSSPHDFPFKPNIDEIEERWHEWEANILEEDKRGPVADPPGQCAIGYIAWFHRVSHPYVDPHEAAIRAPLALQEAHSQLWQPSLERHAYGSAVHAEKRCVKVAGILDEILHSPEVVEDSPVYKELQRAWSIAFAGSDNDTQDQSRRQRRRTNNAESSR